MQNSTKFLIIIIVILFTISYCAGDTCICICCAGNFCTPTLQGNITVASCASSSCESLCQAKYPSQCTNGPGSANYQCRSGGGPIPNWIGVFTMTNRCDTRTCCCPVGQLTLSRVNAYILRVQCQFTGQGCPSGSFSIDDTIEMPVSFNTEITFLDNNIPVSLSDDSRTIFFTNSHFPQCSEIATRGAPSSTATINLASVFLLIGLMSFAQFNL